MSGTEDIYMLPDGTTVSQQPGTPPPAGGTLVAGPDFSGGQPTAAASGASSSTGISPSAIASAAASAGSGGTQFRNISIPVWRDDPALGQTVNVVPSGDNSATALEHDMSTGVPTGTINGDSSANAAENATAKAASSYITPAMFKEKDAYNEFATILMDPKKFRQVQDTLVQSGMINPGQETDVAVLQSRWNDLVRMAVDLKQIKGVDMTPLEVATMIGQNSGAAQLANQNYVRDHLTGTRIQQDQTIDEKTPSQTTLRDLLGRNPTPAELIAYNHGVQETAAAHPLNREIATHYTLGQPDAQTVTYTGGYDQQAAEQQAAQGASPEVAQNQAATTYYNALVNALRPAA